jgi:hypothetical protein
MVAKSRPLLQVTDRTTYDKFVDGMLKEVRVFVWFFFENLILFCFFRAV